MGETNQLVISKASELWDLSNRRNFFKMMAAGGAVVLLPSMLSSCDSVNKLIAPGPGGTGNPLTIDFSAGDTAILQFAYVLEQLEADFYTQVYTRNSFSGTATGSYTATEKSILTDIMYHEILHRDFLKTALGTNGNFTITTDYPGLDFTNPTAVLTAAKAFEFLGVAAYNGAGQYITNATYLTLAGKIVSVEARHASAIADLLSPKTNAFAPQTFENAYRPSKVAAAAQVYIVDKLTFTNAPTTFVQGPNGNG